MDVQSLPLVKVTSADRPRDIDFNSKDSSWDFRRRGQDRGTAATRGVQASPCLVSFVLHMGLRKSTTEKKCLLESGPKRSTIRSRNNTYTSKSLSYIPHWKARNKASWKYLINSRSWRHHSPGKPKKSPHFYHLIRCTEHLLCEWRLVASPWDRGTQLSEGQSVLVSKHKARAISTEGGWKHSKSYFSEVTAAELFVLASSGSGDWSEN